MKLHKSQSNSFQGIKQNEINLIKFKKSKQQRKHLPTSSASPPHLSLCLQVLVAYDDSSVQFLALYAQAQADIPFVNGVRAVDTTLLLEFSLVDSMSKY